MDRSMQEALKEAENYREMLYQQSKDTPKGSDIKIMTELLFTIRDSLRVIEIALMMFLGVLAAHFLGALF